MFNFTVDSGSVAGMTNEAYQSIFSARKAELFMLLKTGSFHFALTKTYLFCWVMVAVWVELHGHARWCDKSEQQG